MLFDTYPESDDEGHVAFLKWHPETLKLQIEHDFALKKLPKLTFDKIMAAIAILSTNDFYKNVRKFNELCNVLSGNEYDPDYWQPADAEDMLWGITEALILYPPDDTDATEFTPEIRGFISKILDNEGIVRPPDILRLGVNPKASSHIDENFNDDPDMYGAIWKVQQEKSDDMVDVLKKDLMEMVRQFQILPLRNGSTESVVKQITMLASGMQPQE